MGGWTDGRMDGRADGWMDGWVDGWTDGWMEGRMGGCVDGWVDGRMDGRTDGWKGGWVGGKESSEKNNNKKHDTTREGTFILFFSVSTRRWKEESRYTVHGTSVHYFVLIGSKLTVGVAECCFIRVRNPACTARERPREGALYKW